MHKHWMPIMQQLAPISPAVLLPVCILPCVSLKRLTSQSPISFALTQSMMSLPPFTQAVFSMHMDNSCAAVLQAVLTSPFPLPLLLLMVGRWGGVETDRKRAEEIFPLLLHHL